jgi:adenylate cyclase
MPKQSQNPAVRAESVVLFAELRNFTRMSEMLEPARVLALADQFFELAARALEAHGGEAAAVHNDSLMAVFRRGAAAQQARGAVAAAQRMLADFGPVAQAWERDFGLRAAVGLGTHRGEAVFGEAGPAQQRIGVVFGDCVSVAERLVHRARAGELVMSDTVLALLSVAELGLDAEPLPPLELFHRPPIRIYGVLRNDRLDFT